ncbi:MAG TPA: CGNR zinc finger domain-containing protein, partial [Ardenticatenaceae bacterium]|nr:CGNR zinc finger domain-containing protein [Ardenticatenaceae bacterium]
AYCAASAVAHLVWAETHYVARWLDASDPRLVLWPVAYSAGQLLLSPELARLKQCPGCGWLFLDLTKNQGRRWCSMNMCGVRDKMRRYHRRSRAATGT